MAPPSYFCTQFLLSRKCDRDKTCLFLHVKLDDVNLEETVPNGSDFVKGRFINELGYAFIVPGRRHRYSEKPCYFNVNGRKCPYDNNCMCAHLSSSKIQNLGGHAKALRSKPETPAEVSYTLHVTMDRTAIPSTSNINKNSASTSNTIESEDDEWLLGATARPLPSSAMITSKDGSKKLKTEHNRDVELNINAPEFVPRTRFSLTRNSEKRLCPFAERDGLCKYPPGECTYLHGDMCDLCARPALHPYNEDRRKKHTQDCIKRHERDMEIAFAVARSKEKVCGICFEIIMQKSSDEQRFGILPSCNHCFCLACIRRWRQSKQFDNKIIRSCPECRIPSDFVCPSAYWVDTKEDKEKLIERYKFALSKKDCKYFKNGRGHCPFGNKCFYRHCLNNGKRIDVGPPPSTNASNNAVQVPPDVIQDLIMLEHLGELICPLDIPDDMDIDEILHMLDYYINSDSDDSDYSD